MSVFQPESQDTVGEMPTHINEVLQGMRTQSLKSATLLALRHNRADIADDLFEISQTTVDGSRDKLIGITGEPVLMGDEAKQGADAMRWQPPDDPDLTSSYPL